MDSVLMFFEIMLINLLLSGDNAIIIAMVSSQLPVKQRNAAVWWGSMAAVFLRCILVAVAVPLLSIPYLQALGGVMLLYIATKLFVDTQGINHKMPDVKSITFWGAIWTIIAADFVMSLDNVLALAAVANGDLVLIMLGIIISIPMIIWGSKLLEKLLSRFFFLSYIGAAVLAFAGGEMIIKDEGLKLVILYKISHVVYLIPLFCIPLVIVAALAKLHIIKK